MAKTITDRDLEFAFEYEGQNYGAKVDVVYKYMGTSGIGSYEFWGEKGYDVGEDVYEANHVIITEVEDLYGNLIPPPKLPQPMIDYICELAYEYSECPVE